MLHFCKVMFLAYVEEMACVVFDFFNATSLVVSKKMLTHTHTHTFNIKSLLRLFSLAGSLGLVHCAIVSNFGRIVRGWSLPKFREL